MLILLVGPLTVTLRLVYVMMVGGYLDSDAETGVCYDGEWLP